MLTWAWCPFSPVPLLGAGDDVGRAGGQVGGQVPPQHLLPAPELRVDAGHGGQGAEARLVLLHLAGVTHPAAAQAALHDGAALVPAPPDIEAGEAVVTEARVLLIRG